MATKTWNGLLTGTLPANSFNNAANWNPAVAVGAGDNLNMAVGWTGNVTMFAANATVNFQDLTTGDTSGAVNAITIGSAGSASVWAAPAGAFFDVAANQVFVWLLGYSGSSVIAKKSAGNLDIGPGTGNPPVSHTGGWDLQAGTLATSASGRYGTGTITMANGTTLSNSSASATAHTNPLTINGNVTFGGTGAVTYSGTVALGASTKTLTIDNTNTFSGTITGTAGFTKAGTGALTISGVSSGPSGISGTVTVTGAVGTTRSLLLVPSSGSSISTYMPNVTAYVVQNNYDYVIPREAAGINAATTDAVFSGNGAVSVLGSSSSANNFTFNSETALAGLTGTTANSNFNIPNGLVLYSASTAGYQFNYVTVKDLPSTVTYTPDSNVAAAIDTRLTYASTDATHTYAATRIDLNHASVNSNANSLLYLIANQATGPLVIGSAGDANSGVQRVGTGNGATLTYRLAGTSTADNTIAGTIRQSGGALAISKEQAGKWILSGANTYTGTTTIAISGGTLVAANNSALGASASTAATTINTSSTLEIAASSINKASSQVTVGGTGDGGNGAIRSQSGTNTFTAAGFTLSAATTRIQADAGRLTLTSAGAITSAASVFGIEKTGAGEVALTQTNSNYLGATTISAGKLVASKLAIVGAVSSLGQPAFANATITMAPGTTLAHEGTTADSTDRILALSSAGTMTIESSGTGAGAVTLASGGTFSWPVGTNTLVLTGGNSADNTCARVISAATNLIKSGTNKWVLTNTLILNSLTVSAGTLNLGSQNQNSLGAISISSGVLENGPNTIQTTAGIAMTGGTITAEITSTTAVTVNSGATARLEPLNVAKANTYTGATAISASAELEVVTQVDPSAAGAGKVLGNSAVTVSGTLTTSPNVNQRGQMRYGGNLTFNSGAILRIGFAA